MKNSFKNALNALVLLVFMVLAWATKQDIPTEAINMEVRINDDSTAFLLKNLEDFDCKNSPILLRADSAGVRVFFRLDSASIKAKAIDTLPFNKFIRFSSLTNKESFSKRHKLKNFSYNVFPHPTKANVEGIFSFDF